MTATAHMTTAQVAEMFGVNPQTVITWANAGRLPHFRTLGGHRRYLVADVEALLASQTTGAA
jgi:excisionase family DNA binding protein